MFDMRKKYKADDLLASWPRMNNVLVTITDEDFLLRLLLRELRGRKRTQFAFRIHSRLNRVRADKERADIVAVTGDTAPSKTSTFAGLRPVL